MEDEYFSDEEISDSDSEAISMSDINELASTPPQNRNVQIETLKSLRDCLKENKILKQRLVIVENELEKYQDYHAPNILPLRDKSTTTSRIEPIPIDLEESRSQKEEKIEVLKSTADKCLQVNIRLPTPTPQLPSPSPIKQDTPSIIQNDVIQVKEIIKEVFIQAPLPILNDFACQTTDDFTDKLKIADLTRQLEISNKKYEDDVNKLNLKITGCEKTINELKSSLESVNKSLETSNVSINEANKKILKLTDENQTIEKYRQTETILRVENDQLIRDLDFKQRLLDEANSKFEDLASTQRKSLDLIDKQKFMIEKLEEDARNQSQLAQSKLEALCVEIQQLKAGLEREESENRRLNEIIVELNKHIERYKQDLKNFNFKEFVAMKRELNTLRQEKEKQFVASASTIGVVSNPNQVTPPLPPIKPSKNSIFEFFK